MLSLLVVAASVVIAQEPKVPVFRSDVKLIRLDVSVVDRRGRAMAGLRADDFLVTEDGRPVDIAYFEAVSPDPQPVDAQAQSLTLGDNQAAQERRILLLVDSGSMSPAQLFRARHSLASYMQSHLRDGDWLRLVNLGAGRAWDGWIPEDRSRLIHAALAINRRGPLWAAAGDMFAPIEHRYEVEGSENAPLIGVSSERFVSMFSRTSGLLGMLEAILVQLQGVPGRKALVLISPGFPQVRGLDHALERVASLAREAAATIYFLDAVGFDDVMPEPSMSLKPAFETAWARSGGAQDLAEATGGFVSRFSNTLVPSLVRLADEMRTYYILGYLPARPDEQRFHRVKVRTRVEGLRVRTKKGYAAR